MKFKLKQAYMRTAETFAKLSHAQRLHVGAIVVKDDRIISIGYNGMPAGWDNNCEDKEYSRGDEGGWISPEEIETQWPHEEVVHESQSDDTVWTHTRRFKLKTKPEVLHAERNALDKLAKGNEGGLGSTMFITHAPCLECAKSIYGAGISHVFYRDSYRSEDGIQFLTKCGVSIEKLSSEDK
jgi:dCMP deaminase